MGQEQVIDISKIDRDYYRRVRACGCTPLQVGHRWLEMRKEIDGGVGNKLISKVLLVVVAVGIVCMIFQRIQGQVALPRLWKTSPSQFYSALRIVRKRGWRLDEVSSKREEKKITRVGALKIAVLRDKGRRDYYV